MSTGRESCSVCGTVSDRLVSNRPLHKGCATTLLICADCVTGVTAVFDDVASPEKRWRLIMADCAWCGRGGVAVAAHGDYTVCAACASTATAIFAAERRGRSTSGKGRRAEA